MTDVDFFKAQQEAVKEQRKLHAGWAVKMVKVMELCEPIAKSAGGKDTTLKYAYAPAVAVFAEVRKHLVATGLAFFCEAEEDIDTIESVTFKEVQNELRETKTYIWRKGYIMHLTDTETGYDVAVRWDSESLHMRDDKSENKMATNACATFLTKTFLIPTEDEVETNQNRSAEHYERVREERRDKKRRERPEGEERRPREERRDDPPREEPRKPPVEKEAPKQEKPAKEAEAPKSEKEVKKPEPEKKEDSVIVPTLKMFLTEMVKRGVVTQEQADTNQLKPLGDLLFQLTGKKSYTVDRHFELLSQIDAYLEQQKKNPVEVIEDFTADSMDDDEEEEVEIAPVEQAELSEDDVKSSFDFDEI